MNNGKNNNSIDGLKVALAIRQLENSEVWHESYDIEEEGVQNILASYGVFFKFSEAELTILKEQLWEMAAREEIKEAERWAEQEHDPLLLSIPKRRAPSPTTLELQHKTWKAEAAQKQQAELDDEVEPDPTIDNLFKEIKLEVISHLSKTG